MDTTQLTASNYLGKVDLDKAFNGTIKDAYMEKVGPEQQDKLILEFEEGPKPMILNQTNLKFLQGEFGFDTNGWNGKVVKVYHDPNVSWAGERVGGTRLDIAEKAQLNDDIPF